MPLDEVWILLPDFSGGGVERQVLELLYRWPPDLPPARIILRTDTGELRETYFKTGVPVSVVGTRHRAGPASSIALTRHLIKSFRVTPPSLVITMLNPVPPVVAARFARLQAPVIAALQNPLHIRGPSSLRSKLAVRALARTSTVVVTAPGLANELTEFGVSSNIIVTIPNGVDMGRYADTSWRPPELPSIAVVARLHPQKRLDIALESFASVAAAGWTLHIAGVGPEELRLKALAHSLSVEDRVTFHGFIQDVPSFLSDKSLLLLTSDFEGFGNVIVEALAVGLPVVSTDVPYGPRFILKGDPLLGHLCPAGDVKAIGNALQIVSTYDTRNATDARRSRAAEFDMDIIAHEWFAVLRNSLSSHSTRRQ